MFADTPTFSSFSVDDIGKAKAFYRDILGLEVVEQEGMGLMLQLAGGSKAFLYPKDDHQPATFTVLNFTVPDIDQAAADLSTHGVNLERYENMYQDSDGITRGKAEGMGPDVAWFTDPAGNILSIIEE